jgi:hypothetical protein
VRTALTNTVSTGNLIEKRRLSMNRWIILAIVGLLAIPLVESSFAQQVPGNPGVDLLLCLAGESIDITAIQEPDEDGIGVAQVTLPHGKSGGGSTHIVVYEDTNGSGELDCGDAVLSIT